MINYAILDSKLYIQLFNIQETIPTGHLILCLKNYGPRELFPQFIVQYYYSEDIPQEIIIPGLMPEQAVIKKNTIVGKTKVVLTIPQRGEKLALLQLILK